MTMSRPTAALFFAASLIAVPVLAQPSARTYVDEQSGLRLDDAIARAIAQEPLTRAVRADVEISRGRLQQAGLRPNPTFSLDHRTEPGGTDNLTSAGVAWPLDLFRRSTRVQTAQRELEAAGFAVSDRERILAGEVRMQYGVAAAAVRELAIASDTVAAVDRQFGLVRARVETDSTPPLERDLLNVELNRLRAIQRLATGRADTALVRLKQLLGMPPDAPLVLGQSIETLVSGIVSAPPTIPLSETRSDVRAAEALVAVADSKIDQAHNEGRFDLSLSANYMRMDAGFPQMGFNATGSLERVRGQFNYFTGGATFVVPLLNRNQGHVAAAQAERIAAGSRRDATLLAARAEAASAAARDEQARQAVDLFTGSIRTLARQNLDVIRETYQLGRATIFDVLAELRRYLEIERDYTDALREAWEARAALKVAVGETK